MKKMMLLASIVALTALMLAAAPAFAQDTPGNACEHRGGGVPPFCRDEDEFDFNFPDLVFCDFNDDGNDDCFAFVDDNNNDGDVFRNIGNDRLNINGPDFGDVGVDSNASIDVSPSQTVNGGGTIDQAAAAS